MIPQFPTDDLVLVRPNTKVDLHIIVSYYFNGMIQITIPGVSQDEETRKHIGHTLKNMADIMIQSRPDNV